ncbi:MAG: DUF5791 family protein [Halobacteriota archaeon]
MLYDAVDDPASVDPADVRRAYDRELKAVVEAIGVPTVADRVDVDAESLRALLEGEQPPLTVETAADILALGESYPDSDAIVFELRDHLLMGMTTGVLDVDTIAARIDVDRTGQEVQQALEGRTRMTLDELAAIQHVIAVRNGNRR